METISDFFTLLFDSKKLIHYGGFSLLLVIIFIETGLVFGFFFPGDTLLFTAGLLCGTNDLEINIFLLLFSVTGAAILGNLIGYISGKYFGKKLFAKEDSFFFKKRHLETTKSYYDKYGGVAIIVGRFLPVVRTFVPILAGTIDMNFFKFKLYNITGAFLWVWTLIPIGYFLGIRFPQLIHQLEYFIIGIFLVTTLFLIKGYLKFKTKKP